MKIFLIGIDIGVAYVNARASFLKKLFSTWTFDVWLIDMYQCYLATRAMVDMNLRLRIPLAPTGAARTIKTSISSEVFK